MTGIVRLRLVLLAVALVFSTFGAARMAQADDGSTVLATVDGEPVTVAEVRLAIVSLPEEYQEMAKTAMAPLMIQQVVDLKLLAALATEADMESDPVFQVEMEFLREQLLREHYLRKIYGERITEDAVQERYDALTASVNAVEEVQARHILVETREDADAVVTALMEGADFEALAKERSTGPSGPAGGDLGFFAKEAMLPEFAEAAFALEIGGVSAPVKTQYGWHVIKLEARRRREPPPLADIVGDIHEELNRVVMSEVLRDAREASAIELTDVDLPALLADPAAASDGAGTDAEAP